MKKTRRIIGLVLAAILLLPAFAFGAESGLDYGAAESWAYFALGEDTGVDVFLICPTVDTRSERNSFDLNDKLKKRFLNALDMEKGIYAEAGRLYSPYYRQMSMNAYKLPEAERLEAQAVAYGDVSAAFRWYLNHENGGRGLILAGFSQGAQMCLELLKEYYGGDSAEAAALRENLVTVYAIGWSVTEEMTAAYPQIIPASGETDTGTVVSFDCEDGTLTDTLVIPAGTRALSINPLNWKTDGTPADKSLNLGAVMAADAPSIPGLCGAYLGSRGELVVTDVTPEEYPPAIDIFPEGAYHVYDYLFFFNNLKENIAARVNAWRGSLPFTDVPKGAWYREGVEYAYEQGLIQGTDTETFAPDVSLDRAQLVTILWRLAGSPAVNWSIPFTDVAEYAWYTEAVRWAVKEKITDRLTGEFRPGDPLQRDEAAFLMWNAAKYMGTDVRIGEDTNILSYDDAFDIREGYAPAMQWAVGSGLIQGIGGSLLGPRYWLTRAQAAVLLQRFGEALKKYAPLSLWTEDAPAKTALLEYLAAVTTAGSPDYIPEMYRIAVFDLDGTLFCETDPNYFDYTLLKYRVLEDPDYKDKASDFEREVANKIKEQNETGKSFSGLEVDHGRAVASAFAGMTVQEFNTYIQEFKQQPMPSYNGILRGDGWYLPMLQVVDLLKQNGFTVYIVSGTDRLIVRGIAYGSPLGLPNRQIIGSDETIVSSGQGDADGLNYVFKEGEELILGGDFLIKNLKMNKVSVIMQEIGQQPVLSFGNSTGDSSMAEYVTSNNPYRSLAFMLCCDDTARENGSESKAEKMVKLCAEFDWVPVSMKNDWVTIYGDGVTYLPGAVEPAA
jgi:phosphoserine phosphatase